jgi:hypothetical protein
MADTTIVYICLQPKFSWKGTDYTAGDAIPGFGDEGRPNAAASNGRVLPVVLESLPEDVQELFVTSEYSPEEASDEDVSEYDSWTVEELKERAKELELTGYSQLHKDELIEVIEAAE